MPAKAVSKKQFRLFKAVEAGEAKLPGLSQRAAGEMTAGQSPVGLPEQTRKARAKRNWRFK